MTQFVSPDDEHHVLETRRELKNKAKCIETNCASRWSFIEKHPKIMLTKVITSKNVPVTPIPLLLKPITNIFELVYFYSVYI